MLYYRRSCGFDFKLQTFQKLTMKNLPTWMKFTKISFLYRFVLLVIWLISKILYRHRVYGVEHVCKGPAIIASNHVSFLDPPIIAISSPEEVFFLARKTLFKKNGFGLLIRALNALPVSGQASDHRVFKQILQILKEGKKLILFPEGERSFDNVFLPIKPGIALLISRSNVPVIPVYLHGVHEAWARGKSFPRLWGKTVCIFGSPLEFDFSAEGDKSRSQEIIADTILNSWKNLKKWYEEGAKGSPP